MEVEIEKGIEGFQINSCKERKNSLGVQRAWLLYCRDLQAKKKALKMSGGVALDFHDEQDIPKMELLNAAYEGNLRKVADLLKHVPIDSYDDDHVTALQIAAFKGNNDMVSFLIDAGASLEECNIVGMTAFHHACREGKILVVDTLLQRGADIHKPTHLGATGLTLAAAGGHLDVVKKLVGLRLELSPKNSGLCPTPLLAAALCSNPQICGFLRMKGAQIDETNEHLQGLSALSAVIVCSRPENSYNTIVSALLDLGADPHKRTLKKKTAIEIAEALKRDEILGNLQDKNRIRHDMLPQPTDFRQLIVNGELEHLAEALHTKETVLPDAATPLMFAVVVGSSQGVRKLIDLRCSVNAQEAKYGYTALMLAAFIREEEIVATLLANGASPSKTEPNTLQQTSLDLYLASNEEINEELAAMLHPNKPVTGKFSLSTGKTITKKLTVGLSKMSSQLRFAPEKTSETGGIRMRDLLENRIQTSLVDGRNQKKLVRVEQILHRHKHITGRKERTLDSDLDIARSLAAEQQSFAITTFYDHFSGTNRERTVENTDTSNNPYYDVAMKYSSESGYYKRRQVTQPARGALGAIYHRREGSDQERRRLLRPNTYLVDGGPSLSAGLMRTTPRMLKKSRESLTQEGLDSPGRASLGSHFNFPHLYETTVRKSVSTPHLQPAHLPPNHVRLTHSHSMVDKRRTPHEDMIWAELRRIGMEKYADLLQKEEIDGELFFTLNSDDLSKMGIKDEEDRNAILQVQNTLLNGQ